MYAVSRELVAFAVERQRDCGLRQTRGMLWNLTRDACSDARALESVGVFRRNFWRVFASKQIDAKTEHSGLHDLACRRDLSALQCSVFRSLVCARYRNPHVDAPGGFEFIDIMQS
jgi:hypothetical protein